MNIQGSFQKFEASLWGVIIKLLSTSPTFQSGVRRAFRLVQDREVIWLAGLILAWTAAGLTVGYFLGFQGLR
jgi:hypothetical protein